MRILPLLAALTAAAFLSACDDKESCTQEVAQKKAADLSAKITEVGTQDPTKLAALAPKMQELVTKVQAGGDDLSGTCKAIDDMMAELTK
ncbi:hypothetical protein [Pseudogemmobacter blasticus]|uniref:Uncharacterized protein n=1 Tax=Fuscovulum blasticum DSM 2131 TaxID=1188250 RepID=A0A2T4JDR1_FUSBL|nr:hypothetical protein [Fuscovulum blasticum]AWD23085.1 hypothetical protein B6K69_16560 [Fuscovulum blasticum]PTE16055.1 hypothetical protein C5F44_03230 [Fuscovulum blasticum DSM 2131]